MCCDICFNQYIDRTIYMRFRSPHRTCYLFTFRLLSSVIMLQTFATALFIFPTYLIPLTLYGQLCLLSFVLFVILLAQFFWQAKGWRVAIVLFQICLSIYFPTALLFWILVVMGDSKSFPCLDALQYYLNDPGRLTVSIELNFLIPMLLITEYYIDGLIFYPPHLFFLLMLLVPHYILYLSLSLMENPLDMHWLSVASPGGIIWLIAIGVLPFISFFILVWCGRNKRMGSSVITNRQTASSRNTTNKSTTNPRTTLSRQPNSQNSQNVQLIRPSGISQGSSRQDFDQRVPLLRRASSGIPPVRQGGIES